MRLECWKNIAKGSYDVGYDYFNDLSFGYEYKLFDSLNPVC